MLDVSNYKDILERCRTNPDREEAHHIADGVLTSLLFELGYREISDLFHEVCDERGFWYA
jgi:hypothetical protein